MFALGFLGSIVLFAQGNAAAAAIRIRLRRRRSPLLLAGTYRKSCAPCHGIKAEGGSGNDLIPASPDLTDEMWDHGSTDGAIFDNIKNGIAPDFNMTPWKDQLKDDEIGTSSTTCGRSRRRSRFPEPLRVQVAHDGDRFVCRLETLGNPKVFRVGEMQRRVEHGRRSPVDEPRPHVADEDEGSVVHAVLTWSSCQTMVSSSTVPMPPGATTKASEVSTK